jgi:teichuronic acid biosynthesis glycosyltransferase TuaG
MPTYNHSEHIGDALNALCPQARYIKQLIVVFDGAGQNESMEKVDRRRPYLPISTVVRPKNGGTALALNTGFLHARGDFWTWVSSDNVMAESWLETLTGYLDDRPNVDAVYTSYVRETGSIVDGEWSATRSSVCHNKPTELISTPYCYIGPSYLARAEFAQRVGRFRGGTAQDYDWWLRAEELGRKIDWIDDPLGTYRVHDNRQSVYNRAEFDGHKWQAEARQRRGLVP